jgi:hypothetical protein
MDTPLEQPGATPLPSSTPSPAPTPTPRASPTPVRTRHAGHVVAIVVGCLALLPALGMLVGGSGIVIAQEAATDDDGYYAFTLDRLESNGVAVTTSELWFDDDDGGPWVLDWLDLDVRLRVDAAGDQEVFVGIARRADVDGYLSERRHTVVTELDHRRPVYRQIPGSELADAPASQDFWVASAAGPGEQQLDWEARGGRWAIVVMNADGSPGVAADMELGARSDAVTPIAIGLLVTGGVVMIVAIGLIVFGARGRVRSDDGGGAPRFDLPSPPSPPSPAAPSARSHDEREYTPTR